MEIIGFGIGLAVALWVAWEVLRLIAKGWILEEEHHFNQERADDLAAIRRDPGAFELRTPNGRVYLGPSGRCFSKDDVFPPTERARQSETLQV